MTRHSPPEAKIALFRSLFRGREDVYAARWDGKNGTRGYTPSCAREWNRQFCKKPAIRCAECEHRELKLLTDQAIYHHLAGKQTIGIYPLLADETCWFLAADFDKKTWLDDALAFMETCKELDIPAALERRGPDRVGMYGFSLTARFRLHLPAVWGAPF